MKRNVKHTFIENNVGLTTGIFYGAIFQRFLCLMVGIGSLFFLELNGFLFTSLSVVSLLFSLKISFDVVRYNGYELVIITDKFLGLSKAEKVIWANDIVNINFENHGLQMATRLMNIFSPKGVHVSYLRDEIEIQLKSGEKIKKKLNLEGGRLEEIIERVKKDLLN